MCGTNNAFPYFVAVDSSTGSSPFFMPKKQSLGSFAFLNLQGFVLQ
jgi:hypothetical protein